MKNMVYWFKCNRGNVHYWPGYFILKPYLPIVQCVLLLTCVRALQRCGLSGWCSASCWPPAAWRAAEAASGRAPASQPCEAAQGWSDSCPHRGPYGRGTPPCLSPGTASTTNSQHHQTTTAATTLLLNDQLVIDVKKSPFGPLSVEIKVAWLTECDVGRLGSKLMVVCFSVPSLSRSSVSMSSSMSSSSSSSSLSVIAHKHSGESSVQLQL